MPAPLWRSSPPKTSQPYKPTAGRLSRRPAALRPSDGIFKEKQTAANRKQRHIKSPPPPSAVGRGPGLFSPSRGNPLPFPNKSHQRGTKEKRKKQTGTNRNNPVRRGRKRKRGRESKSKRKKKNIRKRKFAKASAAPGFSVPFSSELPRFFRESEISNCPCRNGKNVV